VIAVLQAAVLVLGSVIMAAGLVKLLYVPLSLWFEMRMRHRRGRPGHFAELPLVSVVIPGYNEEAVLENCVRSVLRSDYPRLEVILVDDGSTDRTAELMAGFAERDEAVSFVRQENAGKGAALNRGIGHAAGDVLMFVDADGVFASDTVRLMVDGFTAEGVGAVCGDDRPVNLNRVLTRLLAMISHVGTGLVRRSLTMLRCMPIVSGNVGAFRRDVLERTGLFNTDTLGEDLELTWRVHRAGYQVNFVPRALVYAESPSTLRGLWKQRVRWARGLLQSTALHKDMIGNPRYRMFGAFLVFNTLTMIIVPVLQIVVLLLIPGLLFAGADALPTGWLDLLLWLGLLVAVAVLVFSMAQNRALRDLRHLWTLPLWPLYSVFVGLTLISGLWLEARRAPSRWNKLERTGVVSVQERRVQRADRELVLPGGARP
jgi:biofilm PGA synthesis N-glycosyltransferase PgaC